MKNKKVLIGISTIFVIAIFAITLSLTLFKSNDNVVLSDNENNKNFINNSFLTLMLEQSDGTYAESTSGTWPGEGYIFNKELSACENGGELDFDSETNKVILYSNKSDGCYIYFDIYNKPIINSINLSEVTNNSITINVTTTEGTNPISNYYFIINDGIPISTTSNTHTFSGLDRGTIYTIKVYVVDTLGYSSEVSNLNVETENPPVILSEVCSNGDNLSNCIINFYNESGADITNIYYHDSNLSNGANDNSYRFSGGNYLLTNKAQDNNYNEIINVSSTSNESLINFYCDNEKTTFPGCYGSIDFIMSYDESLSFGSYKEAINQAINDGYLDYNVKNFVCFGSDEIQCPKDNLYRIIGVFNNQIKLIKADYASSVHLGNDEAYNSDPSPFWGWYLGELDNVARYDWNSSGENIWSSSNLYLINLNTNFINYLNSINSKWSDEILTSRWYVKGSPSWTGTANRFYSYEKSGTSVSAKIGLMYVSDYGYAIAPSFWSTSIGSYENVNNNWMYLGAYEWTITPYSSDSARIIEISMGGNTYLTYGTTGNIAARPVFYLNSNVQYSSGTGTESDPIRLVV